MKLSAQRWLLGGQVQGVGYRPFVYRLAQSFELSGWVRNESGVVTIHAEGSAERLRDFGTALLARAPSAAAARLIEVTSVPLESARGFRIVASTTGPQVHVAVPLERGPCEACLSELADPHARRYRYPFINCTQCGPRYTILRRLPYDRGNTTLAGFRLCADCAREYADPMDRRFHAQPLACPVCGPSVSWRHATRDEQGVRALSAAVRALRDGDIVAVRGVGGYHLLCDAANQSTLTRLRARKHRPAKPFALLVPERGKDGLNEVRRLALVSVAQAVALRGPSRPIVLLRTRAAAALAAAVAPGLAEVGIMLPYSPMHHLLAEEFGAALVATSGNIGGEPVLTAVTEAEQGLESVADGFLHHDRPIARAAEDPVVRILAHAARPLRLGRGTAPLELRAAVPFRVPTLAIGAHSKATVAFGWGHRAIVSPHLGGYDTPRGRALLERTVAELQSLYGIRAERVVHDAHPAFASTRWAARCGLPATAVWHHHAHASAVAGESGVAAPMLCFTWDGVGLGPDGTLWGGEALWGLPGRWRRVASFRPFRQPGGERAAREPWRSALALCWETGSAWFEGEARGGELLRRAAAAGLNAPCTTAVGRLFDAAAALVGVCSSTSYEGEAAMRLEALCAAPQAPIELPLHRDAEGLWRSDWAPLVSMLQDERESPPVRAGCFHASLAHALVDQAVAVRTDTGAQCVGLAGGVFQNERLTALATRLLSERGFDVHLPCLLPLNDAAISFGQLIEADAPNSLGDE
jgi:hydrogenase maturation protein HypF